MLVALWIAIVLLVGIDQLLKLWAIRVLSPVGEMPFLRFGSTEILGFRYLENDGAVFSSFSGMRYVLIVCTSILIGVCIYAIFHWSKRSRLLGIALALVIAGGLGNLIDRVFRGGLVVDYLEVRLFHFAVFNFADCCVVIGVVLLLFYFLFWDSHVKRKRKVLSDKEDAAHHG